MNRRRPVLRGLAALTAAPALALSAPAPARAQKAERKIALVIGNSRYPAIPLPNPENDARLIAANLRTLNFDTTLQLNLNVRDFRRVLREFLRRMQDEEGAAVLYYAGHGVQIDGRNYLLPVDINLRDQEEVKDESVDIDELFVSRIDRSRSKARIIVLDACRDNPFGPRTRAAGRNAGLAEMAARGTLIAYASAPGAPAEDGPPGSNSIYTRHLAREMMVEGLEVEQMFKRVRVAVLRDTQDRQVPWVNTSLTVNFSFNPGSEQLAAAAAAVAAADERKRMKDELEAMRKALDRAQQGRRDGAPRADAARPDGGRSDTPAADGARVDGSRIEAARADAPRADASRTDVPRADGPRADGPRANDAPAEPQKVAALTRRSLDIALQGDQKLNTDARNTSAPVAVRVYLLRSPNAFRRADFLTLFENDRSTLGSDLVSREELFLRPGQTIRLSKELTPDVRSIAVFAAFREFGGATWRALDTAPETSGAPAPVRIEVGAREVRLIARP